MNNAPSAAHMPRKPKDSPILCDHFTWYLRRKPSGVYFADGRINSSYELGKPSLGTKDREEALRRLRDLDIHKAAEVGLIQLNDQMVSDDVAIDRGWQLYMDRCEQPEILEGVSEGTRKRYRAVRDKHMAFCRFLLKLSKPDGSTTFCYTKQQVTRIIAFCYASPSLVWLGQVITALATSGLRINELAKLRWTDIDLPSNTIRLTDERARPRRKQTGPSIGFGISSAARRTATVPRMPSCWSGLDIATRKS